MISILRTAAIGAAIAIIGLTSSCSKDPDTTPATDTPTHVIMTLNEATPTTITATFAPDDPSFVYHAHLIRKEAFEKDWGGDVVRYLTSYIDDYLVDQNPELTRDQILKDYIFTQGEFRLVEGFLRENTKYLLFAVGVDERGIPNTVPVYKEVTTETLVMHEVTFDIAVSDISITHAKFDIVPTDKELEYLSGVALASQYPSDKAGQAAFAQQFSDQIINAMAQYNSIPFLNAIPYVSVHGDAKKTLANGTLQPNKEYVAVAVGIDPSGLVNTAPSVKKFKTLPAISSSNTFTVNIDKSAVGATLNVTPTNNDPYYVRIFTASSLEGITDAQIISSLVGTGADSLTMTGIQTISTWSKSLISDTEYKIIIFGCDEWATTAVQRIAFNTDKGGDPSKCTFDFEVNFANVRTNYAVTPSDNTVFYASYHEKTSDLESDQKIIDDINKDLQIILNDNTSSEEPEEVLQILYGRDHTESTFVCLPRTSYTVFAVPIDVKTFTVASTKVSKKQFTTPDRTISTADISITEKKFYSGDELFAYDPVTYKIFKQLAATKITVSPNAEAVKWYIQFYPSDLTEKEDVVVINNLVKHGTPLETNTCLREAVYSDIGYPNTLCYIAEDASGELGTLHRELWAPERGKESPIEELINGPKGAAVRIPYRAAFIEPATTSGSSMLERLRAAKASGALRQAAATKSAASPSTDPSTEFSNQPQKDFIGLIR